MTRRVVRMGVDLCTGHGCYPSRVATSGSPDVLTNGIPTVRVGDSWESHGCPPPCVPHGSTQATGSPNTFANGRAVARIGDSIACGSSNKEGSPDTFIN